MKVIRLSLEQLRKFLDSYQGLTYPNEFKGKEGIINLFERIGSIQFDPLNVIGRNADLVLFSRIPNYKESILTEMLYQDRILVDGWDKMMSIYLSKDYPYFEYIRRQKDMEVKQMLSYRRQLDALNYTNEVIDFIKENGPSFAKDINLGKSEKTVWGHGNVSSVVCDYLWHIGKIGIFEKNNVVKKFDLIENLIDHKYLNKLAIEEKEFIKWYILRKIGSVGIYWHKMGPVWQSHFTLKESLRKNIIEELVLENKLSIVAVEGIKETLYIRTNDIRLLDINEIGEKKVKFIAPLDNLLWDRKFLNKVFNFDYTWEVYVPQEKRKYGYYVIPVLYGDKFIARFEPAGTRVNRDFTIKNWWWEKDVMVTEHMKKEIYQAFNQLTNFLACDSLEENFLDNYL